jgi:subtilisin
MPNSSSEVKRRPSHIVLFKRPSEKNAAVLSSVMKVSMAGIATAGTAKLAVGLDQPEAKVFPTLGAASAQLTPDEANRLASADEVDEVFLNETRTLPRFWEGRAEPIPGPALAGVGGSPLLEYLRGLEDAVALVRGYVEAGGAVAPEFRSRRLAAAAGGRSWCLDLIGLTSAFGRATGKGVRIAVLDTGIDTFHPDFHGRFPAANLRSFVDSEPVQDGHGHGTHCAGVVAGPSSPAGGTRYSVAPDAELLIGKVLNDSGVGDDDRILAGMEWAAAAGARVISMSLESPRVANGTYSPLYERMAKVMRERDPGVLLVAAAGNQSRRPHHTAPVSNPAACPSILAIAACDANRRVGDFSCGECDPIGQVDLVGPGVNVLSAWRGGGYKTISGTSMATPHVAGVAALFLEVSPGLSATALAQKLAMSAVALSPRSDFGAGLVQVP